MERNQMDEILKEQGYQASGCMDDKCAVQIGQLIGANSIIAGSIGFVSSSCMISLRIINIRTGKIEKITDYSFTGTLTDALSYGIKNAVLQLAGKPILKNSYEENNKVLARLKIENLYNYGEIEKLLVKRLSWFSKRGSVNALGWEIKKLSEIKYLISYGFMVNKERKCFYYEVITEPWVVTDLFGTSSKSVNLRNKYGVNNGEIESIIIDPLDEIINSKPDSKLKSNSTER